MRPIVKHLIPPSLCSLQSFIAVLVLLYVYLTLQNSVSLHEKIVTTQKKLTNSDHLSNLSPPITKPYQPPVIITHYQSPPPPPPSPPPPSLQSLVKAATGNFYEDFNITWGSYRGKITNNGKELTLSLDKTSGSGFRSNKQYLFAKIDIEMKLIPNNSAGTATTYYLTSHGTHHDEIDFEFLGNLTNQPYTLHTNVYCKGVGNREQQFYLWFDPTADYHTYSILWNSKSIVFYVDNIPIREFKNMEKTDGVPFPKKKPMHIYSTLWNADDWATQGGKVKIDWSLAPFVASYRNFRAKGCIWLADLGASSCDDEFRSYLDRDDDDRSWLDEELDSQQREKMESVRNKHMTYDYCKDVHRFPNGIPKECGGSVWSYPQD